MENGKSYTVLERMTLCFSSYKNRKLKVKPRWFGVCERERRAFFVTFILFEGNLFSISVLSQYIAYWIHFQNIHTFTFQKTLLHTLLLFVFKIVKSLQYILNTHLWKCPENCVLRSNFELKSKSKAPILEFSELLQLISTVPSSMLSEVINSAYLALPPIILISKCVCK